MDNRIAKVKTVDNSRVRCTFYTGDIKEYKLSKFDVRPEDFDSVKITHNGNKLTWSNGYSLYAIDVWMDGLIVDIEWPEPRFQVARILTYYREVLKITQSDIASKTGISQSDVSKYERGDGNPSLDTLTRLADALQKNVEVRFVDKTPPEAPKTEDYIIDSDILPYLPSWKRQGYYTVDDVQNIPEEFNVELIDGSIRMMGQPGTIHQLIASFLNIEIGLFIRKNKGPCVVMQNPALTFEKKDIKNTYLVPDVAVSCNKDNIIKTGLINHADLIIEIVSPGNSQRKHDYGTKFSIYSKAGVYEYWIVDPERRAVTVYTIQDNYMPTIYGFDYDIPVSIYDGKLTINLKEFIIDEDN